jgi:hypothetical protein
MKEGRMIRLVQPFFITHRPYPPMSWYRSLALFFIALTLFLRFLTPIAWAQNESSFPPIDSSDIRKLKAYQTSELIQIDGKLDEPVWKKADRSESFVDLITGKPTHLKTHVSVLWDEKNLYIGYRIQEPEVTAKFTKEDDPIYQDNDVEFFIAGQDAYYEFEINAHGTVYDGLFVWQSACLSGLSSIVPSPTCSPKSLTELATPSILGACGGRFSIGTFPRSSPPYTLTVRSMIRLTKTKVGASKSPCLGKS